MSFVVDLNKCVGCGACKYICLFEAPTPIDEAKVNMKSKAQAVSAADSAKIFAQTTR